MQAYRLTAPQTEGELTDVPQPDPGPGEVLVKVAGAGACHSDLHLMEWPAEMMPIPTPFTLGHENAGWVEALGAGVPEGGPRGLEIGQPVLVYGPWGCGRCHRCAQGMENYCARADELGVFGGGLGADGGMAEHMVVPAARLLVPLSDLDPRDAAPLGDAALTPYHAIKRSLPRLQPGSTALVIGVGGLGQAAVSLLRELCGATVVAADVDEAKLNRASELGAHHTVVSAEGAADEVRGHTGGRGVDVTLDFVGNDATMQLGAAVARRWSDLVIVGLAGGSLSFSAQALPYETTLTTPYWGSLPELQEVVALAEAGRLSVRTERYPLTDAAKAYQQLRDGAVDGRAVITPNG